MSACLSYRMDIILRLCAQTACTPNCYVMHIQRHIHICLIICTKEEGAVQLCQLIAQICHFIWPTVWNPDFCDKKWRILKNKQGLQYLQDLSCVEVEHLFGTATLALCRSVLAIAMTINKISFSVSFVTETKCRHLVGIPKAFWRGHIFFCRPYTKKQ